MGSQKSNDLAHYAEITTIHGIKDLVFSRSRPLRLAWSLCLMATLGLLCWYTYENVKYYLSGPTIMIASTMRLETYPPIHVCTQDWFDDTQAKAYGFTKNETLYLRWFLWNMVLAKPSRTDFPDYLDYTDYPLTSIKAKMKQHNLSSVQDMVSIMSWNVSMKNQGTTATTQKRCLWIPDEENTDTIFSKIYVCQSISNVNRSAENFVNKFPDPFTMSYPYIVVGEDLFGERVFLKDEGNSSYNIEIQWIQKMVLLNRPDFACSTNYDSARACILDCNYKCEVCYCNGTASTTSLNNESFWVLDVLQQCDKSLFNKSRSCKESYDHCTTHCKPCVTWNYHFTLTKRSDHNALPYDGFSDYVHKEYGSVKSLRFTKVPRMIVSEQAYSYKASSMLSYIGGLLGLFCGASVLSFVQVFLFWWGDECHIGRNKVEETGVEDFAQQDNIQSWVQQAALHIPHCKLCSTVTATNIQFQKSEEDQKSQQKADHLANYANNTTIHGIQDFLFMKNKLLKLVWGLFLLAVAILMCEEIYRTVMNYIRAPTATTVIIVPLDTYPTIHVCSDTWYNDIQASSYGFTPEDLAFIRLAFQKPERPWDDYMWMTMKSNDGNNTAFEEQKKSVQLKMEQHNLTTVQDMLNLITWNLSIQGQEFVTSKRWRERVTEIGNNTYVCHSVSNASAEHDLSITLPEHVGTDEFIVVGEDPFGEGMKYGYVYVEPSQWVPRNITLNIMDINKLSLLGKDGMCNKGYNSSGVCLQNCASKKDLCSCNGTMKIASYENNEDFFLLASRHDCHDNDSCNQNHDRCVEMCEPCTTWDYLVQTKPYDIYDTDGFLNITMIPLMRVTEEYYTSPPRSLLSSIGGLMGMFCGASVLSLVQLFLFWLDNGCLLSKTKGTNRDNTDHHIKAWLQQATLRLPQCEDCKKLTSMRTQDNQGGEVKTSQQKRNHLANYAEATSIHGIKDLVFCKNKLIKLVWGLMLLIVFCGMCEEIYRTVRYYAGSPTDFDQGIILMDKYPPVHACWDVTKAFVDVSYVFMYANDDTLRTALVDDFDHEEIRNMLDMLLGFPVDVNNTVRASIKEKMQKIKSLRSVQDMLNTVAADARIAKESMLPDDPAPQKRWRREDDGAYYVCYVFSNFTVRDGGLRITREIMNLTDYSPIPPSFVVIGEDPFGFHHNIGKVETGSFIGVIVAISQSSKLSLIDKGGTCSHDYNSSRVCLQDCLSNEAACNSNSTARWFSYDSNETFWLLDDPADYANTTCQHSHQNCSEKCKLIPCTTWTYQSFVVSSSFYQKFNDFPLVTLNLNNPNMIVSQEYYTYPESSLLANIGGLVSLFCGGSLLSVVQVILFWWGDGCCGRKGKGRKEETTVVPEDDIHKWIQHAALHCT